MTFPADRWLARILVAVLMASAACTTLTPIPPPPDQVLASANARLVASRDTASSMSKRGRFTNEQFASVRAAQDRARQLLDDAKTALALGDVNKAMSNIDGANKLLGAAEVLFREGQPSAR